MCIYHNLADLDSGKDDTDGFCPVTSPNQLLTSLFQPNRLYLIRERCELRKVEQAFPYTHTLCEYTTITHNRRFEDGTEMPATEVLCESCNALIESGRWKGKTEFHIRDGNSGKEEVKLIKSTTRRSPMNQNNPVTLNMDDLERESTFHDLRGNDREKAPLSKGRNKHTESSSAAMHGFEACREKRRSDNYDEDDGGENDFSDDEDVEAANPAIEELRLLARELATNLSPEDHAESIDGVQDGSFRAALAEYYKAVKKTRKNNLYPPELERTPMTAVSSLREAEQGHKRSASAAFSSSSNSSSPDESQLSAFRSTIKRLRTDRSSLTDRVAKLMYEKHEAEAREVELLKQLSAHSTSRHQDNGDTDDETSSWKAETSSVGSPTAQQGQNWKVEKTVS